MNAADTFGRTQIPRWTYKAISIEVKSFPLHGSILENTYAFLQAVLQGRFTLKELNAVGFIKYNNCEQVYYCVNTSSIEGQTYHPEDHRVMLVNETNISWS